MKKKTEWLVYSTEKGRTCPLCGESRRQCCCSRQTKQAQGDGVVRISRQTKGRKGSGVCLVTGLPLQEAELKALARELKQLCGTGGTVKNGVIEIQGDHRDQLLAALLKSGYRAKLAGG